MVLLLVVLPVAGVLITIDDYLPLEGNGSYCRSRAVWKYWENWADLAIRGALSGIGFAIDGGWQAKPSVFLLIIGAFAVFMLIFFGRRIYSEI